ncbi:MAG: murein biosynthesis integral membrane protein MurJ [Deltaproteobacteria bacterium]|nr:murein biosynthesis integral membrane protein MurJ [Deltaproteobacteria bacterium]
MTKELAVTHLLKKGSVITGITLISRPLGYIREAIQAYVFGATVLVDAFIVAFNFPELVQTLFFSGASSAILLPVSTKYLKDNKEFSSVYSTFLNLTFFITVFFSLILVLFSDQLVKLISPGFSPYARYLTRNLFIIMTPVIVMHALLSVMKSFLNAKDHFAAPELSGIIWNIVFIVSCLFLSEHIGIYSLAVGVSVGSLLQVIMQYPFLRRHGIRYRIQIDFNHEAVTQVRKLFFGALIGASIVPINNCIDRIIASYLPEGHVASLTYAFRIFILPFSLFAVPIYTVAFSSISRLYHEKNWKSLFSQLDNSIVLMCVTLVPSLFLLCGIRTEIVKLLYERGAFTSYETELTSRALFGYGLGLLFYGLSILFVRAFNGIHDTKTPAVAGITSIFLNALLDIILMRPYQNFGIALATSIVSLYNFLLLFLIWRRRTGYRMGAQTLFTIGKTFLPGIVILLYISLIRTFTKDAIFIISTSLILAFIVVCLFFKNLVGESLKTRA